MLVAEKLSYLLLVSTCKQPNELLNSPTAAAVPLLVFLSYSEVTWVLLRASSGHSLLALLRLSSTATRARFRPGGRLEAARSCSAPPWEGAPSPLNR
ncbi:hypothetical protein GOODEAATRI_029898 [Goodea atripinnis]|uniref:Secreted protein n=1 Tax=Goodea atripinnis TaxID=208336 RepID=A0ABV0Q2X2_9TELE